MTNPIRLRTGSLYQAAQAVTRTALQRGTLQPIPTQIRYVQSHGVRFLVRELRTPTAPKPPVEPSSPRNSPENPFLPYDPDLFVADISDSHVCLLNKYTVMDHHLLIVTRQFEHQEQWLTLDDFRALWACMAEFDGLGFYNGGTVAGASQTHKHLQYVPFPMAPTPPYIPLGRLLAPARPGKIETELDLPFVHAFLRTGGFEAAGHESAAADAFAAYPALAAAAQIDPAGIGQGGGQTHAYNLLATRRWLLLVPRRAEAVDGISVNGLGFAGHLLTRDRVQTAYVQTAGAMNILAAVGVIR